MPLANAFAPESVGFSLRQYTIHIQTVEREQARIPAYGYDSYLAGRFQCSVHIGKISGNVGVRIKAVNHVKIFAKGGTLLWQIRSRSSANDEHIDFILPICRLLDGY